MYGRRSGRENKEWWRDQSMLRFFMLKMYEQLVSYTTLHLVTRYMCVALFSSKNVMESVKAFYTVQANSFCVIVSVVHKQSRFACYQNGDCIQS